MHLLSNRCLQWVLALNLVSLLSVAGCKEGTKAERETGASSAQRESGANKGAASESAPGTSVVNNATGESPAPRVAAGSMAPDFELPSSTGGMATLSTLLKESAVALVFYRSAVW